jgi:hypothetical protein
MKTYLDIVSQEEPNPEPVTASRKNVLASCEIREFFGCSYPVPSNKLLADFR